MMSEWMRSKYDAVRRPVPPYLPAQYFLMKYPESNEAKYQHDKAFLEFQSIDRHNFRAHYKLLRSVTKNQEFLHYLDENARAIRRRIKDEHKDLRIKFMRDWDLTGQCVYSNRLEQENYYWNYLELQQHYSMYKCCKRLAKPYVLPNPSTSLPEVIIPECSSAPANVMPCAPPPSPVSPLTSDDEKE